MATNDITRSSAIVVKPVQRFTYLCILIVAAVLTIYSINGVWNLHAEGMTYLGDFLVYYSNGWLWNHAPDYNPYNYELLYAHQNLLSQQQIQTHFPEQAIGTDQHPITINLPFINPPYVTFLTGLFAWLPYQPATLLMLACNTILILIMVTLLFRSYAHQLPLIQYTVITLFLSCFGIWIALAQGQLSLICALCIILYPIAMQKQNHWLLIISLIGISLKPNLYYLLAIHFIFLSEYVRMRIVACLFATGLFAVTCLAFGLGVWQDYFNIGSWAMWHGPLEDTSNGIGPEFMLNIRGVLSNLASLTGYDATQALSFANTGNYMIMALCAVFAVKLCLHYRNNKEIYWKLCFPLLVCLSLVSNPYMHLQDFISWLVILLLYAAQCQHQAEYIRNFGRFLGLTLLVFVMSMVTRNIHSPLLSVLSCLMLLLNLFYYFRAINNIRIYTNTEQ